MVRQKDINMVGDQSKPDITSIIKTEFLEEVMSSFP